MKPAPPLLSGDTTAPNPQPPDVVTPLGRTRLRARKQTNECSLSKTPRPRPGAVKGVQIMGLFVTRPPLRSPFNRRWARGAHQTCKYQLNRSGCPRTPLIGLEWGWVVCVCQRSIVGLPENTAAAAGEPRHSGHPPLGAAADMSIPSGGTKKGRHPAADSGACRKLCDPGRQLH